MCSCVGWDLNATHTLSGILIQRVTQFSDVLFGLQLIQEAIIHGDIHKDTMQLADYWLLVSMLLSDKLLFI